MWMFVDVGKMLRAPKVRMALMTKGQLRDAASNVDEENDGSYQDRVSPSGRQLSLNLYEQFPYRKDRLEGAGESMLLWRQGKY